jgi:regulator of sirC expression with transglutaminase-like and TPR domain
VALAPRFAPAHRGLGLVHERVGETALAIRALQTYLRLSPGAPDAAAVRARIERLRR